MKPQSTDLTAEQSLDIITSMIRQAQGNARRNSFYFLLWGWVVTLANLGMFFLSQMDYSRPYLVWLITIPAWILSLYRGFRQNRQERVHTHLDSISLALWFAFAVCIFTVIGFGHKINYQISPLILLICAIPTVVSGVVFRFRPLLAGGILFWISGIVCFQVGAAYQPLIGATAIIGGYLIPGYMLQRKKED
jgi:hypothetical protein